MSEQERVARIIVKDLLRVIDMLMPGIGHIAVDDHRLLNEAPLKARQWIAQKEMEEL